MIHLEALSTDQSVGYEILKVIARTATRASSLTQTLFLLIDWISITHPHPLCQDGIANVATKTWGLELSCRAKELADEQEGRLKESDCTLLRPQVLA
ncbi:hypothetical protein MHYP_G00354050 [Metynnis hypsauchen]